MWEAIVWIYIINGVLLIDHEIDSAYWREWELFRLPGGINGFLLIHLPLLGLIFYGLVLVVNRSTAGLYFSLGLGLSGILAFVIHSIFLKKGYQEFRTPLSLTILVAGLVASLVQIGLTLTMLKA
jgi:hypothetical protein